MFNLKKAKIESPENREQALGDTLERKESLEGETHGTYNTLLKKVRKDEKRDTTTEDQLKEKREGNVAEGRLTEGQLDHHKSPEGFVPMRADGLDELQMKPLDALNAAQEAEQVKAFNDAATKDAETAFWDRYTGAQLDGPETKVPSQVSPTGNQLQNQYERLKSISPEDWGKHESVKKMVMASMQDADAILYYVYHKASSENRELNEDEQSIVDGITSDKVRLASML